MGDIRMICVGRLIYRHDTQENICADNTQQAVAGTRPLISKAEAEGIICYLLREGFARSLNYSAEYP